MNPYASPLTKSRPGNLQRRVNWLCVFFVSLFAAAGASMLACNHVVLTGIGAYYIGVAGYMLGRAGLTRIDVAG